MQLPSFVLDVDDVIEIHADQIELYGGSMGIRDLPLLESAVAAPLSSFGGQLLHDDLAAMAGAYLYHLVKNHPFIDGNKRVGTAAALTFLQGNQYEIACPAIELTEAVLAVATGEWDKRRITDFLRAKMRPANVA